MRKFLDAVNLDAASLLNLVIF
eukprot:SAG31_NODE_12306_length_950_cov_1.977673_1_plen_21_part_10